MTTLHDRLADLADHAPAGGPVPDLWERGERYHRRRRAGTAVIVATAVVLMAVVAGVSWQRAAPVPVPAPARGPVGLPDRMWTPSRWLPTAERPGQLVAITPADRGTWAGARPGLVGVSASSGDYAFLDLPDADMESGGELAPDGRHVAYWLTGATTGTPLRRSGPVTGVAVIDTTTGEVSRHWIRTEHGLQPDFLVWADAETLVFSAGQIGGGDDDPGSGPSTSTFGAVIAWRLGEEPRRVPGVEPGSDLAGAGHGRILIGTVSDRAGREHLLVDLADPGRARHVDVPRFAGAIEPLHFVALGPVGTQVALVPGSRTPHRVKAGSVENLAEIPGTESTLGVVDWTDRDTIVTLGIADGWERSGLYRVSVTTGRSRKIVRLDADAGPGAWQFATDLLDAPSVAARRPPTPLDPRVTAGLSVSVVVAALGALVLWRRRVRP
jgi:hypothetical protein